MTVSRVDETMSALEQLMSVGISGTELNGLWRHRSRQGDGKHRPIRFLLPPSVRKSYIIYTFWCRAGQAVLKLWKTQTKRQGNEPFEQQKLWDDAGGQQRSRRFIGDGFSWRRDAGTRILPPGLSPAVMGDSNLLGSGHCWESLENSMEWLEIPHKY